MDDRDIGTSGHCTTSIFSVDQPFRAVAVGTKAEKLSAFIIEFHNFSAAVN